MRYFAKHFVRILRPRRTRIEREEFPPTPRDRELRRAKKITEKSGSIRAAGKFFSLYTLLALVEPLSHDIKPFITAFFRGVEVFALCFVHVAYLLEDPLLLILFCAT